LRRGAAQRIVQGVATSDETPSLEQIHAVMAEAHARAESLAGHLVGMAEEDAAALVASERCHMRVARRDGEAWPLTADGAPSRITVVVAGGRIIEAQARW
jgi:3-dehydroquinate dehydratase